MSTVEAELEQQKSAKIEQVAARGSELAAQVGANSERVREFLSHYFRHVEADEVVDRTSDDLLGLVESHFRVARQRESASPNVQVVTPTSDQDGWSAGGASVVQIVTDDRPFLVDSVTMEVLRQGWSIREVYHPQYAVRRDVSGRLDDIVRTREADIDPAVLRESWMHLEILPPSGDTDTDLAGRLTEGLKHVLRQVEEAVQDWTRMRGEAEQTIDILRESPSSIFEGEVQSATELLEWLVDNHFTFLGYREYTLSDTAAGLTYTPVTGSGLGILRGDQDPEGTFHAVPPTNSPPRLLVITKANAKSQVHRPAYLDYIGVRQFDEDGKVVGERRFLGLFASSAYSESVNRIPMLRTKANELLRRAGYEAMSHGGKAILDVLDTYPRDELLQTSVKELGPIVDRVSHLKERRQVRLFIRRDFYGRFVSCLVYLPRDRYTTSVRNKMEDLLLGALGGESIDYTARVSESVLARLHFVVRMPQGVRLGAVDERALERELTRATRSWNDELVDEVSSDSAGAGLNALAAALPEGYKEDFTARQAVLDLTALAAIDDDSQMAMALYVPEVADDEADLRLKIFRPDESISLSRVLPHLTLLGVDVIDERPYELAGEPKSWIYDFGLKVPGGTESVESRWTDEARNRFMDAFQAAYLEQTESDAFNVLVMLAELNWRQVAVLRAIARYLKQTGTTHSQTYIAQALRANVDIAKALVALFETKFDPARGAEATDERRAEVDAAAEQVRAALDDVASLDHDRIIRSYLAVISATVRTNVFQADAEAITFKVLPREIEGIPEPRPAFELFVCSPRIEGVHLRFGMVARGGLRWSDRAEDYRTEVLGLVKAQMVKNTVIVPVGAKGGFYCKQLPDPGRDRDAWQAEGRACYRLFISSLLDVTDNIVESAVVPPIDVVRYDSDDPYLVVAADKGTATFSDLANSISDEHGFWLSDAFASGGSAGYDHKKMGITARGGWESVKRHFREMGIDCQSEDFTVVGVGDMSGDVFGNGMLLSEHTRLVAAFDHRHIFIDPEPDAARGFAERRRLFDLPRSSWADYDTALISEGGGVFPRSLKSIKINDRMRTALGVDDSVTALAPTELITAILRSPVDLFWNGGIGTYIKASSETHAQVGDKANDGVRVNGGDLRARCVGEGGNLGVTQLGRIEYATTGGRINTDFIDNSAGVDSSDYEVNIKILLSGEVAAGRLSMADRNELLASMTDDVADLVLEHNYDQNLALANGIHQSVSMAGVHEDWMDQLVDHGELDRAIEFLPETEEVEERRADQRGLTAPELSTLMAYTKIVLEKKILTSDLPDDPYLGDRLITYFPQALRERYEAIMPEHRLHREIITTVAVNRFVNSSGITCYFRLAGETGAAAADVIRAQLAARAIYRAGVHETAIRKLDNVIDADVQTVMRLEVRTLVERCTRWILNSRRAPIDVVAAVEQFADGVEQVKEALPRILSGRDAEAYEQRLAAFVEAGVSEDLSSAIAKLPLAYGALAIVAIAVRDGRDPVRVAETHFALGQALGLDRLLRRIIELPREDRWQTRARATLRDDLHTTHAQLTAAVLGSDDGTGPVASLVDEWQQADSLVGSTVETLETICESPSDLARMSVGLRVVRSLLPQEE
ncbi:MAG: NAD-glutamate dehydrogenase [Propionibacteriaceae bacterium]